LELDGLMADYDGQFPADKKAAYDKAYDDVPMDTPKPVKKPEAAKKAPTDDEWWRTIIVPVPHKGEKRDAYLKNPDTIGSLYDACGTDIDARNRLFGFVKFYEPKGWEKRDGTKMPASAADEKFREALDAFADWHEKNGGDAEYRD
jgi:hypothetical protein